MLVLNLGSIILTVAQPIPSAWLLGALLLLPFCIHRVGLYEIRGVKANEGAIALFGMFLALIYSGLCYQAFEHSILSVFIGFLICLGTYYSGRYILRP